MPAAADTAQPSDTTPPSPAAAGKSGKRASSKAPDPAAADQAAVAPADTTADTTEPVEDAAAEPEAPAPPEPEPGWFRNTSVVPLLSMPDQYPSATLKPGEARWLPDDPRHPNLERCDAPEPAAEPGPAAADADTAGSES